MWLEVDSQKLFKQLDTISLKDQTLNSLVTSWMEHGNKLYQNREHPSAMGIKHHRTVQAFWEPSIMGDQNISAREAD